jgi:hypothetical protein
MTVETIHATKESPMLTLKNPFAKPTPATEPAGSSMPEADKALKRWQLEQGRTRKRVEELMGQLEAARVALEQSEQTLGERMADGVDSTTATDAMKHASDHVRALEVALAVATKKDVTAEAELKQAERQVASDAEDAASARVLARAAEGEAILKTLRQFALDLARDQKELGEIRRTNGTERSAAGVGEIPDQLMFFLKLALDPGTGTGLRPYRMRPYASWTECLEDVCGMKAQL